MATGVERRIGKFEFAQSGPLFLHELAGLSPTAQAILLHVLQEYVVERVGGAEPFLSTYVSSPRLTNSS
jgi:two-component system, NtrC family, C4-dicarboxylate transport response regulator DctD